MAEGWSATDVAYKLMDMHAHREEMLVHFTEDDATPILPQHAVQFLSAAVNMELDRSAHGRKADGEKLKAKYVKRLRSGANLFFRKMGILEKWRYTNNMQTQGKGSPFLSDEVGHYLRALRRQEVRSASYEPTAHHPITSRDFCKFEITMARHVHHQLDVLIVWCQQVRTLRSPSAACSSAFSLLRQTSRRSYQIFRRSI